MFRHAVYSHRSMDASNQKAENVAKMYNASQLAQIVIVIKSSDFGFTAKGQAEIVC